MDESIIKRYGNLERKQKFEQNVKGYLEAMDMIQIDLDKMLENSMKINIIFQEAIFQRAEQYLEQDNQQIPPEKLMENRKPKCKMSF